MSSISCQLRLVLVTFGLAMTLTAGSGSGQPVEPPGTAQGGAERSLESDDELSNTKVLERRESLRSRVEEIERLRSENTRDDFLSQELAELERTDRILSNQLRELRRRRDLEKPPESPLPQTLDEWIGHPPPYSIGDLDAILDARDLTAAALASSEDQVEVAIRELDRAREEMKEIEALLRKDRAQSFVTAETPGGEHQEFDLRATSAKENLRLREIELDNARRVFDLDAERAATMDVLSHELMDSVVVTATDRGYVLEELAKQRDGLDAKTAAAREEVTKAEDRWAAAGEKLDLIAEPAPELVALFDARRLELDSAQLHLEALSLRKERLEQEADHWDLRFSILGDGLEAIQLADAARLLERDLEELERSRRLAEVQLHERRLFLRQTIDRESATIEGGSLHRRIKEQSIALRGMVALYEEEIEGIDRSARLARRCLEEVSSQSGRMGFARRAVMLRDKLSQLWRYEITAADDRPITVGKVILAIFLIVLGFLVAKTTSRRLETSVFQKLGLTPGAAAAFQTLIFYVLLVIFVFWALRLVAIPLTIFTVLGGVLAIGIGFGSQNIVNNFISGLIILAERPVKVGDLIDLDGMFGKVERIGPRSSHIRSGDNTHVIVPNSSFLEKKVLNWTMSDDIVRSQVDVGVAYGSPVERVAELMQQAIADEKKTLEEPSSEVLFMDFGDNSLAFRAYFWARIRRPLDLQRAQSALRFRIDTLFRENGIEIAFPQRDVHLDSKRPLEVTIQAGRSDADPSDRQDPA